MASHYMIAMPLENIAAHPHELPVFTYGRGRNYTVFEKIYALHGPTPLKVNIERIRARLQLAVYPQDSPSGTSWPMDFVGNKPLVLSAPALRRRSWVLMCGELSIRRPLGCERRLDCPSAMV